MLKQIWIELLLDAKPFSCLVIINKVISTLAKDQYVSDSTISQAISFGIASSIVDGSEALAVLSATQHARKYI